MNYTVLGYLLYLPIALAMTIWVARTLHRNGRIFVVAAFRGNEAMGDAVNHLLVVGFYLINIGFIAFALRYGEKPVDLQTMIEFLSTKLGVVLLVLGLMHFFNMFNFDKMRRKGARPEVAAAPVPAPTPAIYPPVLPPRVTG
ncbi:MAG: hypothetical protein NTV51_28830 [Verrucomicrobia bacterium]|nr:hypothetical protein [Verrucomicrobiota bacterium]